MRDNETYVVNGGCSIVILAFSTIAAIILVGWMIVDGIISAIKGGTEEEEIKTCTHLTLHSEHGQMDFYECDGYDVDVKEKRDGKIKYSVTKDDQEIMEGETRNYEWTEEVHEETSELSADKALQKTKRLPYYNLKKTTN